jgi:non-ribosomal peptide synthetase component F
MEFLRPIFKNVKKLNLPGDYVKNDDINGSCGYFKYHFSEQMYQRLHYVCVKNETTLFTVLCSAFSILLSNRTGQNSITFLTTVSGHDHEQLKDMIGYFANTILVSMNVNRTQSIQENIENTRSVVADALQHKDIPYEMVLREMNKVPNWSEKQLPNILFLLLKHNKRLDFTNGEIVEVEEIHNRNAKFDISFIMSESEDGIEADIEYRSDLFNRKTIDSMVNEFATILDEINTHTHLKIDDIKLTSEENPDNRSNHSNLQGGFNFDMK